mmetsp:Transcript_59347/g.120950  ORF Transcript_59347/g.120950 Transcript_59347/m.120950 type:complete len:138 (-) Transcript_59347:473-886(-)
MGRGAGVDIGAPWCKEQGVAGFVGWRSEASQAAAKTLVQGPCATGEVLMRSPLGPARARQGDTGGAQAASTEAKGAGGGGRWCRTRAGDACAGAVAVQAGGGDAAPVVGTPQGPSLMPRSSRVTTAPTGRQGVGTSG